MPRPLAMPRRDEIDPQDLEAYDRALTHWTRTLSPDGSILNPWARAMLHSPRFAEQRAELSRLLRTAPDRGGTFSHSDREWVGQVLSVHLQSNTIQLVHVPDAVAVGVRPDAIRALYARQDAGLTDDERLLATFVREVADGTVTDESFDAIERRLGSRGVVEYTFYITMIITVYRQAQAFGWPEPSDAEILQVLERTERRPDAAHV